MNGEPIIKTAEYIMHFYGGNDYAEKVEDYGDYLAFLTDSRREDVKVAINAVIKAREA